MTDEEKKALEEQQKEIEKAKEGKNLELSQVETLKRLKEENDKLKAKNADLEQAKADAYDLILNEGKVPSNEQKHRTSQEIRDELRKNASKNTNLRNWQLSIELDEAVKRETGESSFLPKGHDANGDAYSPTVQELADAEAISTNIKECLEEAGTDMKTFTGGNPEEFNNALRKRRL